MIKTCVVYEELVLDRCTGQFNDPSQKQPGTRRVVDAVGKIDVDKRMRKGRKVGSITTALSTKVYSLGQKQEDRLDLITAVLKLNCILSTTVAMQFTFQSSPSGFIGQHKLYYCIISLVVAVVKSPMTR